MSALKAKLNHPFGIYVSPSNNEVYIADFGNHVIRKILQNGSIVTIAGNGTRGYSGDYGSATKAQLCNPSGVFVSSNNEVFIADFGNHRIRKILVDGTIITIAGNGIGGYNGDYIRADNAQLYYPRSVFESANEVYIADESNNRVRKILKNGIIVTIAGNGNCGYNGDDIMATEAMVDNPRDVFFLQSSREVYFTDSNRIRKVLKSGIIKTIAGTGEKGYKGNNGLAINAKLDNPFGICVSSNKEVYFSDNNNHAIRKILQNGLIVSIAGNGLKGTSGNGGAETSQLFGPRGVTVSSNDEVYFAEQGLHRIRKIRNGMIMTIAGSLNPGYSGDSPYHISVYPHFGKSFDSYPKNDLKKYSRDELFGLQIYAFMPLVERKSPQFSQILKKEKVLCSMTSSQLLIIQRLIDYLIYDNDIDGLTFDQDLVLDVLLILGLFKNNEFFNLKKELIITFLNSLTLTNFPSKWEIIEGLLKKCKELGIQNYILECLHNYCAEYAVIQMRTEEGNALLYSLPIMVRNCVIIFSKLTITRTMPIKLTEKIEVTPQSIETLLNDKRTSDVCIKMGQDKYLYCHKTILSSESSFFAALFESGSSFSDLSDGIFTPDESEDLASLEIIVKYCYGIFITNIPLSKTFALLDMATKHEVEYLTHYCRKNMTLTTSNYFTLVSIFENYIDNPLLEGFFEELARFGIEHKKTLFDNENSYIIEKLWKAIFKSEYRH